LLAEKCHVGTFLRFFVPPSFVRLFVFLPFWRMLAFFCVLSRSDETTPPSRERTYREKREGGRILRAFFGRVILCLLFFLEEEL
jgi:hypothetical protein